MALSIISCDNEKDEIAQPQIDELDSDQLIPKIQRFVQLANDLKDGKMLKSDPEKMTVEEAVYYISSSLNYIYCDHTFQPAKTILLRTAIEMPVISQEEKILLVNAAEGYNSAVTLIRTKFQNQIEQNKKLLGCYINGIVLSPNHDKVTVKVTAILGIGSAHPIMGEFLPNQEYWWERNSYMCDNTGSEGAPNIIEQQMNALFKLAPPPFCRYWWPDLDTVKFNALNYQVDQTPDFVCDYKIFYCSGTHGQIYTYDVQCIGVEPSENIHEMDFYCENLKSIYETFLNQISPLKYQGNMIFHGSSELGTTYKIFHSPELYYGVRMMDCSCPSYPISID